MTDRERELLAVLTIEDLLLELYEDGVKLGQLAAHLNVEKSALVEAVSRASDRPKVKRGRRRPEVLLPYSQTSEGKDPGEGGSVPITPADSPDNPGHPGGPRRCHLCGREYLGGQTNRRFCTEGCADLDWRRRQGDDVDAQVEMRVNPPTCGDCGRPLWGRRPGTKWCDDNCARKARRRRTGK